MTLSTYPHRSPIFPNGGQWGLKGAAAVLLASGLLATLARPVFWQEGRFLDRSDATPEGDLTTADDIRIPPSGSLPGQRSSGETITIGPRSSTDREATAPFVAPTSPRAAASDQRVAIRSSNSFQQSPAVSPEALLSESGAATAVAESAASLQPLTPNLAELLLPPTIFAPRSAGAIAQPPTRSPDAAIATIPALPPEPSFSPVPPAAGQPPRSSQPLDVPPPPGRVAVPSTPREAIEPDAVPPSTNEAVPPDPAIPAPPPITATRPEQIRVDQFVVEGSTVFTPEALATVALNAVQGSAGLDDGDETAITIDPCDPPELTTLAEPLFLSPSDLVAASNAVEQCYVDNDFINSGAFIAESELTNDDGILAITVVEGSLEAINVQIERAGLFGLHPGYVEARLRRAIGEPFNLDDLVEAVQLLELDPLISQISTEIVPGTETGTSILNVSAVQDDGTDVAVFLDNNRSPSVGSLRTGVIASQANLLGIGDRLTLGYNFSEGSNEFSAGYTVPINAQNGTIGLNFQTTDSRVIEEPFSILDIVSTSREYELFYRQPIILTPNEEFALRFSGTLRESQAEFLERIEGESIPFPGTGTDAEGRNRTTVVRFGQEWTRRDPQQVISLLSEFSLGLDAFGATILPIPPDGNFFVWRGQGQWARRLGPDSLFILRGNAQLANGPLLPNEQFSFGGQGAGRGYRLNTLLRDNGWFLSSEFRLPLLRFNEPQTLVQIAPFFEVGGGWNEGAFPNTLFLTSTGLGLLAQIEDDIIARLDWGIPLSDFETSGTDLQDSGIYFSITVTP